MGKKTRMGSVVSLRDFMKRKFKTHTVNSSSVLPDCKHLRELSLEDLEKVFGGMSHEKFEKWRVETINESW